MAILKTPEDIKIMAEGGHILGEVLQALKKESRPGVTTEFLDKLSLDLIKKSGASPAFLGYRPSGSKRAYPYTLCASVNDGVVHGRPSGYILKDGDLLKLDLGLKFKGLYLDSAITVGIGKISKLAEKLIEVTKKSLDLAIREAQSGKTLGDIGSTIENYATKHNFSIIRDLTGHGIGKNLHEDPNVLNYGRPGRGEDIEIGMVLAIEPMVSAGIPPGGGKIKQMPDDSFVIADGSLAAHFEHTVAVTGNGPVVLTIV